MSEKEWKRDFMILGKKPIVILPSYNEELPHEYVDEVILVDDASGDGASLGADELDINTIIHFSSDGKKI